MERRAWVRTAATRNAPAAASHGQGDPPAAPAPAAVAEANHKSGANGAAEDDTALRYTIAPRSALRVCEDCMSVEITVVDAFTETPFAGNPAAVCLLKEARPEAWMQN